MMYDDEDDENDEDDDDDNDKYREDKYLLSAWYHDGPLPCHDTVIFVPFHIFL